MESREYWIKRANERIEISIKKSDEISKEIWKAYISTSKYINEEIKSIVKNFKELGILSEKEAYKLLKNAYDEVSVKKLRKVFSKIIDEDKRMEALRIINAPAYNHRIERLNRLLKDIETKTKELNNFTEEKMTKAFLDIFSDTYDKAIFDIQKGVGFRFAYSYMSVERINSILKNEWSGKNYSQIIWENTKKLSREIKNELMISVMSGRSYIKTSAAINDKFSAGAYNSLRLVRTESNYIAGQAELESYKECGIDKYVFIATLDMKTSSICASLDGKEFYVKDAQPGINCNPMHPNCRSTTAALINKIGLEKMKRSAKDPVTGKLYKVPKNMTYSQWKKVNQHYA